MPVFCGDSNIEEEAKWALSNSAPTPTHRHPLSLIPTTTHPKKFSHPPLLTQNNAPPIQNNVPYNTV